MTDEVEEIVEEINLLEEALVALEKCENPGCLIKRVSKSGVYQKKIALTVKEFKKLKLAHQRDYYIIIINKNTKGD